MDNKFEIRDNKLVNRSSGEVIPDDEPTFILRARDILALGVLNYYQVRSDRDGCTQYHMQLVEDVIKRFTDFRNNHPERMKQPGSTRGQKSQTTTQTTV